MKPRSWLSRKLLRRAISRTALVAVAALACFGFFVAAARASDEAPQWMHAVVDVPLPPHDEETNAVLLYDEKDVSIAPSGNLRTSVRRAYKILRPGGRSYGEVAIFITPRRKVLALRAWCIPQTGKDYVVKDKEAAEMSAPGIPGAEMLTDVKARVIHIPAAEPGNIVGYEYETEEQPLILQDVWDFQGEAPVRESHYTLELPSGWTYLSKWANFSQVQPVDNGNNRWQWSVSDVSGIRREVDMPPVRGVAGQMVLYFVPPGESAANAFTSWTQMGGWYRNLTSARLDAPSGLKQTVATLTASATATLGKMQAIAEYVQHNVRYVAIELGIGGYQPHAASETFTHGYGDCKDKATLTIAMLREIGVESYYVIINSQRGAVDPDMPAYVGAFNHAIVAVRLPDAVTNSSLVAVVQHPKYGRLLFFDPTNELTPFGEIGSYLQASWGLLVTPDGGELYQLPTQPPEMNGIKRTAKLTLDSSGTLKGEVAEVRIGDRAWRERRELDELRNDHDRIKPIESLLAGSLSSFHIIKATITNIQQTDLPFAFNYSFEAPNYAKTAGGLILVRPRVIGVKTREIAKPKHPRQYPFEFGGVVMDVDSFDITIPPGYQVDDVPAPANADYAFASYHSKIEVQGDTIHYSRTYEIKEVSVPVEQAEKVKSFYQLIAADERSMVVLKSLAK